MSEWTFITHHGAVLALVARERRITARNIASEVGITERSVHRVLSDLEESGYISKEKVRRMNRYHVELSKSLRLPGFADTNVGELVKLLLDSPSAQKKKSAARSR